MANQEQIAILRQWATAWNHWRETQNIVRGLAKIYERGQQTAKSKEWLAKLPAQATDGR